MFDKVCENFAFEKSATPKWIHIGNQSIYIVRSDDVDGVWCWCATSKLSDKLTLSIDQFGCVANVNIV